MIARNKVHELMQKHNGDLKDCFVTATEVYSELEKNGIKSNFWYKTIKELEKMEKELRKTGAYIVVAKRWGSDQSHNYIVDLCKGIDEAKEIAQLEMTERGGKYGMQIIAFRDEINTEPEIVYEIECPYKNKVNIPTDKA